MMKRNRLICLVLIYAIFPGFFASRVPAQNQIPQTVAQKKGLHFRLREGVGKTAESETAKTAETAKLSAAEAEAIFRRLPPMDVEISDNADFSRRADSLPPPKTGKVIPVKFPADEQPPPAPKAENSSALEVVSAAPNGFVPFAKDLSITFSQPMIAVTSQNKASETVPVELSPQVEGEWRWLGTNTLIFDARGRFPMATKFTARVAGGTKSATGGVLQDDFSWNFETPPPKVESFTPNGETVRRDAILLAKFNQQIKAEDVFPKISASAGGQKIALRLANQAEIEADKKLSERVKKLLPGSWIAFRADGLLPVDSNITVNFEAGMPSAEGSQLSVLPDSFVFKTFGTLKLANFYCGYDSDKKECGSYEDLRIEFNNPIDTASFDKSLVKIEPKIENAEIAVYGNQIEIAGCCKQTRRIYKVSVSEKLKDVFGQMLGSSRTDFVKVR